MFKLYKSKAIFCFVIAQALLAIFIRISLLAIARCFVLFIRNVALFSLFNFSCNLFNVEVNVDNWANLTKIKVKKCLYYQKIYLFPLDKLLKCFSKI